MPTSYIIAYDIPADNRRTKVAKILEDYGARRQWSVFEVLLSDADYIAMRERLVRILDPDEDAVVAFPLCAACADKRDHISLPPDKPEEDLDPDMLIF